MKKLLLLLSAVALATAPPAGAQRIIATIPIGMPDSSNLVAVGVNPVTNRVYVTDYNYNSTYVLDGAANAVVATLPYGGGGVCVNADANRVYLGDFDDIVALDGSTNAIQMRIHTSDRTLRIALDPTLNKLYAAGFVSNNVTVVNLTSSTEEASVPERLSDADLVVNPNTHVVYTTRQSDPMGHNDAVAIDGVSDVEFAAYLPGQVLFAVAVNPNTNHLYIGDDQGNVQVLDAATGALLDTVSLGTNSNGAYDMLVDLGTNRIYVANDFNGTSQLLTLDMADDKVISTMPLAGIVRSMAVNSVTHRLYILTVPGYSPSFGGNALFVLDTPTPAYAQAQRALRLAGGLGVSDGDDAGLDVEQDAPPSTRINLLDAVRLARKAAGLDM